MTASDVEIVAAPSLRRAHVHRDRPARRGRAGDATSSTSSGPCPGRSCPPCQALHVGSLGAALEPGRDERASTWWSRPWTGSCSSATTPTCARPFVDDAERTWREVRELGARCTLVKLSDEDARDRAPRAPTRTRWPVRCSAGERTELVAAHPRVEGRDGVHRYGHGERRSPARSRWSTPSARATRSWPARWPSSPTPTRSRQGLPQRPGRRAHELRRRWRVEVAAVTCERRGANPPRRQDLPPDWPVPCLSLTCSRGPAGALRARGPITTGSMAMPQWLVDTSTAVAAGSRQPRQSTMPSRRL